ncbi:hypothetical protein CGCSCA4_v014758 [Colletotrichum siamense]|uniref:Uncharacterized protein n=1 Tax=Colletotrichum siamense TaxID=690259 RepID=A0A9P5BMV0_COLSI|nr:hypothetical protein CGCSCA4_v014758 [Colletotrichum siamense]KAF4845063.1 hypothetical protein CGCSCA2_v013768 [Colletotrichum siamense]
MAATSSGDVGFVLPAYRNLLVATRLGATFNVGNVWYADQAGRTAFALKEVRTPAGDCALFFQQWVVSGEVNPVLEHLRTDNCALDRSLSFPVSAIAAVFWSAGGPPRAILKLGTYDSHTPAPRRQIVRVQFVDQVHKRQFLYYILPLVMTLTEKSE